MDATILYLSLWLPGKSSTPGVWLFTGQSCCCFFHCRDSDFWYWAEEEIKGTSVPLYFGARRMRDAVTEQFAACAFHCSLMMFQVESGYKLLLLRMSNWERKLFRLFEWDMDQSWANMASLDGAPWSVWTSWCEEPVSVLCESMILFATCSLISYWMIFKKELRLQKAFRHTPMQPI